MGQLGEEPTDRIELVGDPDLMAAVEHGQWLMVGGDATVRMTKPGAAPWTGTLLSFAPAKRLDIEWTLQSGEKRSHRLYDSDPNRHDIGSHLPIKGARYTRDATVVDAGPAARATIRYRIQSGAERTKDFFADQRIDGFFTQHENGSVTAHLFKPAE
jgi:hypothetical protein